MFMLARFTSVGLVAFLLAGCAGQPLTVVRSLAMKESSFDVGQLTPQDRFSLDDVIRVETFLTWPDPGEEDGQHDARWDWYRDGAFVSRTSRSNLRFESTPYGLWTRRAAAALGAGNYRVDTFVDGKLLASTHLVINPG